ncbi:MAG: hypothetical protein JWO56_2076, partial [Acidobacteria bacterium]|nr:hypothetical protein [Acidobacteriota bacterium]
RKESLFARSEAAESCHLAMKVESSKRRQFSCLPCGATNVGPRRATRGRRRATTSISPCDNVTLRVRNLVSSVRQRRRSLPQRHPARVTASPRTSVHAAGPRRDVTFGARQCGVAGRPRRISRAGTWCRSGGTSHRRDGNVASDRRGVARACDGVANDGRERRAGADRHGRACPGRLELRALMRPCGVILLQLSAFARLALDNSQRPSYLLSTKLPTSGFSALCGCRRYGGAG